MFCVMSEMRFLRILSIDTGGVDSAEGGVDSVEGGVEPLGELSIPGREIVSGAGTGSGVEVMS